MDDLVTALENAEPCGENRCCEMSVRGGCLCFSAAAALRAAAEREKEYEAALRFYSDPSKYTDIHGDDVTVPDFYSELDFGETARAVLAKHGKPAAS